MVPPLSPETPLEQQLFDAAAGHPSAAQGAAPGGEGPLEAGGERRGARRADRGASKPGRIARDFPGQADEGFVLMHETSLKNAITTQPQVRNTAGRVFGGALMRYALELAFATAYAFSGCRTGVLFARRSTPRRRRVTQVRPTTRSIAQVDFGGPSRSARCSL